IEPGRPRPDRVFLEFDGVFQVAEVFVNGERTGEHRGRSTGFAIDITEFIQTSDNLVAVRVNNNWNPQLAPRAGEHIFSGGIYRDVYLLMTHPLRIGSQWIDVREVSREHASFFVATEIRKDWDFRAEYRVHTR